MFGFLIRRRGRTRMDLTDWLAWAEAEGEPAYRLLAQFLRLRVELGGEPDEVRGLLDVVDLGRQAGDEWDDRGGGVAVLDITPPVGFRMAGYF
jgi:hypothetical protein